MELDIRAEQEAMEQEMLEDQYHEQQMYNDVDYFCKYVLENFKIKGKNNRIGYKIYNTYEDRTCNKGSKK